MAEQTISTENTEVMAMHVALQLTFAGQLPGLADRDEVREQYTLNYKAVREALKEERAAPARVQTNALRQGRTSRNG